MKPYIFLFALGFTVLASHAQDSLLWSSGHRLTGNDFRGRPGLDTSVLAMTACALPYHYHKTAGHLNFMVRCLFIKSASWNRLPADADLLAHEQGHFDIAEIFARTLRKRFSEDSMATADWKRQMNAVIREVLNEKDIFNERYDRETDNSKNRNEQQRWNDLIARRLDELNAYRRESP